MNEYNEHLEEKEQLKNLKIIIATVFVLSILCILMSVSPEAIRESASANSNAQFAEINELINKMVGMMPFIPSLSGVILAVVIFLEKKAKEYDRDS